MSEVRSAADLAQVLLEHIRGGDLPSSSVLCPDRLASVMHEEPERLAEALSLLEAMEETERAGTHWLVRSHRIGASRDILKRVRPLLMAVVRLAARRATPTEAEAISVEQARFSGRIGTGTHAERVDAYRRFLILLAEASGSLFYSASVAQLLKEADFMIEEAIRIDQERLTIPYYDGELLRLTEAIKASDEAAAAQAMQDHLLLVGRYLDLMDER